MKTSIHAISAAVSALALTLLLLSSVGAEESAPAGADKPAALPGTGTTAPAAALPGDPGQIAAQFTLTDTDGNKHSLSDYLKQDKIVVLEWFNPDCPVVKGYHAEGAKPAIKNAYSFAKENGAAWLAINSGAAGKQGNGLERNRTARTEYGIEYPVLLDESGEVGHSYSAATTPHMFVISPDGVIAYNGAPDDSGWTGSEAKANFVIEAITALQQKMAVTTAKTTPVGCSVKYAK